MEYMKNTEIKLTQILENLSRMPSRVSELNDTPKLSPEQKRKLLEMVSKFNEYGQSLQVESKIIDTAKALAEIAEMAEAYACNESADWFHRDVVKKDFGNVKKTVGEFQKLAKECYSNLQKLSALYEDMGHVMGRYYEIKELNPVSEVSPNPNNIQSQKELPVGGPAPTQVKEVSTNPSNIQSQKNLPQGNSAKDMTSKITQGGPVLSPTAKPVPNFGVIARIQT